MTDIRATTLKMVLSGSTCEKVAKRVVKAMVMVASGGPVVLELRDVEDPLPGEDEL